MNKEYVNVNGVQYEQKDLGHHLELVPVEMFPSMEQMEQQRQKMFVYRNMAERAMALAQVE